MRMQIVIPTSSAVDTPAVRSYIAARLLVRNDMPIEFVVNDGDEACPDLEQAGLDDCDDPQETLAQVVEDALPDRGEEAQFLIAGVSRSYQEVLLAAAEWFNHLMSNRLQYGQLAVVYVVPFPFTAQLLEQVEPLQRIPGMALNLIEVQERDEYVLFDPSRGPRFMVERDRLQESLDYMLTELHDMDLAYSESD